MVEWVGAPSIKKFHFFNYGVMGYMLLAHQPIHSLTLQSTFHLSFFSIKLISLLLLFIVELNAQGKRKEINCWDWLIFFLSAGEEPPAHNCRRRQRKREERQPNASFNSFQFFQFVSFRYRLGAGPLHSIQSAMRSINHLQWLTAAQVASFIPFPFFLLVWLN